MLFPRFSNNYKILLLIIKALVISAFSFCYVTNIGLIYTMDYPVWNAKDLEMRIKGNYPDMSIIIARCEFRDELRENRFELLKDLVQFFKEYMPRYGYKHLCTEDDDYKYYQTLNSPCIKCGFMGLFCSPDEMRWGWMG